jgi:hypothetical protein
MLAFRSIVSVLVSFVRSFSTNSRPPCGRPPAAAVLGRQTIGLVGHNVTVAHRRK